MATNSYDPASSFHFKVEIDGLELGTWTAVDGLTAEYEVQDYKEGGQNGFVHKLPGRLTYGVVTLSRPVDKDSGKVATWFSSLQATVKKWTANITCYNENNEVVTQWNLVDVYPKKWTGPNFASTQNQVAIEKLELIHNGFMGEMAGLGGAGAAASSAKGWV